MDITWLWGEIEYGEPIFKKDHYRKGIATLKLDSLQALKEKESDL